jgi:hypothetical protein
MKSFLAIVGALCSVAQLTMGGSELEFVTFDEKNLQKNGYLLDGQVLWPGGIAHLWFYPD